MHTLDTIRQLPITSPMMLLVSDSFVSILPRMEKTPKAESVITPEVLQKYAKQIKQAKLEEFRSFLDFTAMKLRDRRKHKIENFVKDVGF